MEPSKEAIAVRITRLNRLILGKVTSGSSKLKKTIDREALLDALTALYDECNDDPVKKCDELVKAFVDKYRSTLADLRRTRVCFSDFELVQTIGRGHFGEVHMVREKQTCDVYALKVLRKEQARKRAAGAAEDERDVLANAQGPWIPKLQYAFQDSTNLYLVMELCNGGDLAGMLSRRNHPLSERDAAFYVAEVTHALKALHSMGYVHRDVKPHNILLDRCGHVKLGDLGSCARLSEGGCAAAPVGTPDYVAPELLAAADCAATHSVCLQYCRGIVNTAISACDYWSLGVVAFELVTLRRPFSTGDDDSVPKILSNIQQYERDPNAEPPFEPFPNGPSNGWRGLVSGLLRVAPARRFSYLDTLRHPALTHLASHNIRDQAPPWVPCVRGPEDASHFSPPPRDPPPPSAAPFRARPPFAGQLPFIGYSFVAPEESDDHSGGFSVSHDCTAIDLATFKSAEKLSAMRGREIAALQSKLAAAEALASAEAERTRREAEAEAERTRARLQADITALSLQNRRLERQIEIEKEERMALERANQQMSSGIAERNCAELRVAQATSGELRSERDALRAELQRLEAKVAELQAECASAVAAADTARVQQRHYKDSIAKERALRRQTLSGGEAESREAGARVAQAEASVAKEVRAREQAEKRLATLEAEHSSLQAELDDARRELARTQESLGERRRAADSTSEQVRELQAQVAQERARTQALVAQVQELERGLSDAARREATLEEQCARTEARLHERIEAADVRAATALHDDQRHREKVNTLEQLVRQLEREVSALEKRTCPECAARQAEKQAGSHHNNVTTQQDDYVTTRREDHNVATPRQEEYHVAHSDTESVGDAHVAVHAQVAALREQLQRAEDKIQAKVEEIAALRQEARTANLARWRKEREFNELQVESKSTARELKRLEERISALTEAKREAEKKASTLQSEMTTLRPQHEQASKDLERLKETSEKLKTALDAALNEVDRSRNDIRKLKSELQYSEKRRLHAEEQEELSSRERSQLRDEVVELRAQNNDLVQNNKALQEACSLMEEQLTDLEKLADIHEVKNKDLATETQRVRSELEMCRARLSEAERQVAERSSAASLAASQHDEARAQAHHQHCQLQLLTERLENRESRVTELEARVATLESERSGTEAALGSAARRLRDLQEECAALRTRAHEHHAHALQLQASLAEAQEEIAAVREASEAATAWWRTRETKADATLRQQAKLIDFLQAKVEEAGRKKCSLSNKLFGRSGRRPAASPPLRRANRELREEVERLRARLAGHNGENNFPPTPRRERDKSSTTVNGKRSLDVPDSTQDKTLQIVWSDGSRDRLRVSRADDVMLLTQADKEIRARLHSPTADNLPQNEANRAFTVKLESSERGAHAAVVCGSEAERGAWVARLTPAPAPAFIPAPLARLDAPPTAALYIAPNAVAIGCTDGLHSLRGPICLEFDADVSPPRHASSTTVERIAAAGGRALVVCTGMLVHGGLLALGSALRRATNLKPSVGVSKVRLPDTTQPHIVKAISGDTKEGPCAVVACGRRVFLLRFDASSTEFRVARSLTVDRAPTDLLLTPRTLYIAGEKPLKINLPSGALEQFAIDDPTVAAAAKKHSPPRAILLLRDDPVEILLCYAECGVFVDEYGKRTRSEDPKWSSAVHGWEFVHPFLYIAGEDRVTIIYITDEAYRSPPCTCDATSVASSASECYVPEIFNLKVKEPSLLGTAPNGVIIQSRIDDGYIVSILEGMSAFRSIGASVESLATSISDTKGSSSDLAQSLTDLAQSMTDLTPQDDSLESVVVSTGFLADIRKRARLLRIKNRKEQSPEDVIKEILTAEVSLKRQSGRKSPAMISEYDSDESDETEQNGTETTKGTADICAEMFARQVRFQ